MAMNELQSRLEYLVSYSSQLIFIGCDSASQQQNALQQFLSSQHDNVDVAYINAHAEFTDIQCRAQIYQQLLNQTGFSQSPLNAHLIKTLPEQSGPVLICICAAQHLSDLIVSELWDLVIQNKEYGNGRHLNVLLFGDAQWTHNAKINLSERNAHIPILLSTETVSSETGLSPLDESISVNRARIQAKLQAQSNSATDELETSNSVIQQGWFKLLAMLLFVGLFGAILFWQYPQEISRFLQPSFTETQQQDIDSERVQQSALSDEPGTRNDINAESTEHEMQASSNIAEKDTSKTNNTLAITKSTEPSDKLDDTKQNIEVSQSQAQTKIDTQDLTSQSEALVTDWKTEVDKIKQTKPKQVTQEVTEDPQPTELSDANPLLSLPDGRYLLQLAAMGDSNIRDDYIVEHALEDNSWTYTTQRFGGDWHVILFAQTFESVAQARSYISSLPSTIDQSQPFAKSSQQIKQELLADAPQQ
ncbi:hypothetical protein [Aliiglaciecola litoralis]|uniref:SPOR domain-containing protein n=1 Tax=Aliiglaciecola litoralis TaxID=582857 RepID=A0ABN1LPT2_9ALTE